MNGRRLQRWLPVILLAAAAAVPNVLRAQGVEELQYRQVISANPFGLLFELFNAEYERAMTASSTAGVGGSTYPKSGDDYLNADVFYRYYPTSGAFEGWAFGGKVGMTRVPKFGTYFGYGFDVNHSWLLGRNQNFYVGLGFGLKRLVATESDKNDAGKSPVKFIPTFRLINVGFAF